jgi:hypothetical protein
VRVRAAGHQQRDRALWLVVAGCVLRRQWLQGLNARPSESVLQAPEGELIGTQHVACWLAIMHSGAH